MATPQESIDSFNQTVNVLVKLRDKVQVYGDDWATLPAGMKTAIKSVVSTTITTSKNNLDAFNTMVQSL